MSDSAVSTGSVTRYPMGVVICHWLAAILVGVIIVTGLQMEDLPRGPEKLALIDLHGSLGTTLLAVMLFRLWFRLRGPLPADPDSGSKATNSLATLVHWAFYALIIGQIIGGLVTVWTVSRPVWFLGFIEVASIMAKDIDLHHTVEDAHKLNWLIIAGLVGLHLVAVGYHAMAAKDGFIGRMLPINTK